MAGNAREVELKININKTLVLIVFLTINTKKTMTISVNNETIECLEKFSYLESVVAEEEEAQIKICNQICIKTPFGVFNSYQISGNLNKRKETELRIFKNNVLLVLVYGCESRGIRKGLTNRL